LQIIEIDDTGPDPFAGYGMDGGGEPINFDGAGTKGGGYAPTIGAPRSSEHWSEWDTYSAQGKNIVEGKPKRVRPQSAGVVRLSTPGGNDYGGGATSPMRGGGGGGGGYAPTVGGARSSEHWSEWDAYSAHGKNIVHGAPSRFDQGQGGQQQHGHQSHRPHQQHHQQQQQQQQKQKARPQSARPYKPASGKAIPIRMDPFDEFKVQKRSLVIDGTAGKPAAVRSVTATRAIGQAVRAVAQTGGARRPIELAKSRANDVATVAATGPSARNPTSSHRQFVRNLERMMRQANANR
jgi:hypothetical protein